MCDCLDKLNLSIARLDHLLTCLASIINRLSEVYGNDTDEEMESESTDEENSNDF